MIRVFANHPGRRPFSLLVVLLSALAACSPETVAAPESSSSSARSDAGAPRTSAQAPAETASPTAAGMAEVMQPPARAPSTKEAPRGGAGGSGESKQEKPSMAGAGGNLSAKGAMGGAGGALMGSTKQPECTQLSSCCSGLKDDNDREDCEQLVQRDDADRCERGASDFCQVNAAGMGGGGSMTTMMNTAGMGAQAAACMQLSMCCSTLDGLQQRACMQAVEEARANACSTLLERRCPELGPAPQEPACATLHGCCGKQSEPRALEQCRRALEDGNRRNCERASMLLCQ